MKIDLERFKASLPYASELFGIYQPLLGWKSQLTMDRMAKSQDSILLNLSTRAVSRTAADVRVIQSKESFNTSNLKLQNILSTSFLPRVAVAVNSIASRVVGLQLPPDNKPNPKRWVVLLDKETLNNQLRTSKDWIEA